jgi:hypothetical protein
LRLIFSLFCAVQGHEQRKPQHPVDHAVHETTYASCIFVLFSAANDVNKRHMSARYLDLLYLLTDSKQSTCLQMIVRFFVLFAGQTRLKKRYFAKSDDIS